MFTLFSTTYAANAQNNSIFAAQTTAGDFLLTGISIFVLAAGIFSIVFILYGGVLLILSGGKDEKIKPAINTIRYAVIGVIVTIATIFIFPIFGRLIGLDVKQYANPEKILERITELGNKIFGVDSQTISAEDSETIEQIPTNFSDL